MKGLLDPESPFNQFLVRVADLCIINILMLICCIPIVTIGAAVTAAHKTTQDFVFDTGSGVVVPFFKAFKSSFKQATIVWLLEMFLIAVLAGYFFLISIYMTGSNRTVSFVILGVAVFALLALANYIYPLMARYENTLKQHFLNSILLLLFNFPKTISMVLISLIPAVIAFFFTTYFIQYGIFFLIFIFAFLIMINSYLIKPIFEDLEEKKAEAEAKAAEEATKIAAETTAIFEESQESGAEETDNAE